MRINNLQFVTNQPMNASFNSQPQQLFNVFGYSIQAVITGTPNGALKIQASDDPPAASGVTPAQLPTNWTDVTNSSTSVSAAGTAMWNVADVGYNWVRLVYTDASGGTSTATLSANVNIKGF